MLEIEILSSSDRGHTLHHNGSFNAEDELIVFDTRNDDTKIGETGEIGVINSKTKKEQIIYKTSNQSLYGPGVGAASFHPNEDRVVFIHGLPNANQENPYSMSRRFGMMVDIQKPLIGNPADSRDVIEPYLAGTLRGGSHSHSWSPDGDMLSFTYNDEFVNPELRTVGVMLKSKDEIKVENEPGNIQGQYYSAILAEVVTIPENGSDQISKAYDECWLESRDNNKDSRNILVFQGITKNKEGKSVIEIFLVEVDPDKILQDKEVIGRKGDMIQVPKGIKARRLTHSENGLSDFRHWLRSSPDGKYIYCLVKDKNGYNQIAQCEVKTGELKTISNFDFSINSPINVDPKGEEIVFISNNNVYLFGIESLSEVLVTNFTDDDLPLVGVPVFSRNGSKIAFNQFVKKDGKENVQIKLIHYR